jgi:aconitate hydratase
VQPLDDNISELHIDGRRYRAVSLARAAGADLPGLATLPLCLRVLVENMLRHPAEEGASPADVARLVARESGSFAYRPARVLLQDLLGVPLLVDFAAMRDAAVRDGLDPAVVNPAVPADFIIDHSLTVVHWGSADARARNESATFRQNLERFRFLRWAQQAFTNLRVFPPDSGIMHQINLEYLAKVVWTDESGAIPLLYPDTMIGTDSHTPMVNGLGVVGWGVGGLEAEAAMLGQALIYANPEVLGVRLHGTPNEGVTATDLVLTVTERLRELGVVGKFVEFFGHGLDALGVADRATIANMAPEYGATCVYFPVDRHTLDYLRLTGRDAAQVALVEGYCRTQGLWRDADTPAPVFDSVLEFDLGAVRPCLAGPRRPQDRVDLHAVPRSFAHELGHYFERSESDRAARHPVAGVAHDLGDGDVVVAAITSCTNTSNPANLVAAGLLARRAAALGLKTKPWVKTSLAPGSRVVADYLQAAGLQRDLDALGFHVAGFGCTTCAGMSGPIAPELARTIEEEALVCVAVLSGNRNFEGRIHPHCRASYLASPALVVAYALAGTLTLDLTRDPLGHAPDGTPVFLADLWPSGAEIREAVAVNLSPGMFRHRYAGVLRGSDDWRGLDAGDDLLYAWDETSTYIRRPPFFDDTGPRTGPPSLDGLRPLLLLGDSITTDHISPSSTIGAGSDAAHYLAECGIDERDFHSYGTRRGNFEVVARATFANRRLRNAMVPELTGSVTRVMPEGDVTTVYRAARIYRERGEGMLVIAGSEYGCGSSRDTAAKGPWLIGVRAVLARGFERIHRSNLIGMGILPLEFPEGVSAESLRLTGAETFDVLDLGGALAPGMTARLRIRSPAREPEEIAVTVRLDTRSEVESYRCGGILPRIYRRLTGQAPAEAAPT